MKAPNYELALALAQADWNNSETARRINSRAAARGHPGVAVDRSRVSRWIRRGEKPRSPVPELLAELLSERLGQAFTPQRLGIAPSLSVLVPLDEHEHEALAEHAAAVNVPVEHYAQALLRLALSSTVQTGVPNPRNQRDL
ncbi:hypothetical protein [Streptomyces sp. NPDC054940]